VTGKPLGLGGSAGRAEATGRGVMIAAREALPKVGLEARDCRVVIQGFGNVGSHAARLMSRAGYKIVSVSDVSGAIHEPRGLDVADVLKWLAERRVLTGYPRAQHIKSAEQFVLDCEILIPAAVEGQITTKNARDVKAKLIVEGANGPTTPAADQILEQRGVTIVPDILANAGGVTVSYFEWVQDRMGYFWTEDEVNTRLERVMVESFAEVERTAREQRSSLRIGAYVHAIGRVVKAFRARGLFA
jgi:glutamate dehydrogenase (NAD(P)+)